MIKARELKRLLKTLDNKADLWIEDGDMLAYRDPEGDIGSIEVGGFDDDEEMEIEDE